MEKTAAGGMARKAAGKKSIAVDGSDNGRLEDRSRNSSVHKGDGTWQTIFKSGAGTTVGGKGLHLGTLPRWTYAPIALGTAAIIYLSGIASGVFSNPLANMQQPRPAPTATAGKVTPTITIDRLATIRHYNPDLADLVNQQVWMNDEVRSRIFISDISRYVSSGKYLFDTVTIGSDKFGIAILGNNPKKIELGMEIAKTIAPLYMQKLDPGKIQSLLVVEFKETPGLSGTNSTVTLSSDASDLQVVMRETWLALFGPYSSRNKEQIAGFSSAFDEPVAEFAMHYANEHLSQIKPPWYEDEKLQILTPFKDTRPIALDLRVKFLKYQYQSAPKNFKPLTKIQLLPLDMNKPETFQPLVDTMNVGLVFLSDYYNLVGDDAFWASMRYVYDFRIANAPADPKKPVELPNETLTEILGKNVPPSKLSQFNTLVGKYVYGTVPINAQ